jgi:hypothetical protein
MFDPVRRILLAPLLLLAAACADRTPTAVPAPATPPAGAALVACHADVRALAMTCTAAGPGPTGGASAAVLGGQGVNVRLRNTGVAYEDGVFRTDVTVENLVAQALGTADGVTPSPEGVRVFFSVPPQATRGTGEVTVANPDGQGFFTAAGQDFFRYPGILAPGDTSAARQWRFNMPDSVDAFSFQVYVAAAVAREAGWIGVSPPVPSLGVGQAMQLAATVHEVSGRPVPGQAVAWSSSDTSVATVAADGTVTGVRVGSVTVAATSGTRTGSAVVQVGSASGDGVPPTLRGLSVSPARLNVDGADSVAVDIHLSDGGTGAHSVAIWFVGPQAQHERACAAFEPVSGTRAEGVFRCHVAIPRHSEGGVWRVGYVDMSDRAGNPRITGTAALEAAGVRTSLFVRSAAPDLTAPTVVSTAFSADSVTADGLDSLGVQVEVADAVAGVHYTEVRFASPSGQQSAECIAPGPAAGTVRAGTFACRMALPAGAEAGTWTVTYVLAVDSVGNRRTLYTEALQAAGFRTTLHVSSAANDVTPPVLHGFSLSPGFVGANGLDYVTVTMQLADAGVGVREAGVDFTSPSGSGHVACAAFTPASGTRNDGTFQCRLYVPAGAETGTWTLVYVEAYDLAGNGASLGRAELEAAGYPTTLLVTP